MSGLSISGNFMESPLQTLTTSPNDSLALIHRMAQLCMLVQSLPILWADLRLPIPSKVLQVTNTSS